MHHPLSKYTWIHQVKMTGDTCCLFVITNEKTAAEQLYEAFSNYSWNMYYIPDFSDVKLGLNFFGYETIMLGLDRTDGQADNIHEIYCAWIEDGDLQVINNSVKGKAIVPGE